MSTLKQVVLDGRFLVLDTETTGLDNDSEIVEVAVVNAQGVPQLMTFVRPTRPIPAEATVVHGITNEMVQGAPSWMDVRLVLARLLKGQEVIVYNAGYDLRMVLQTDRAHGLPAYSWLADARAWWCAMQEYAVFHGEWNSYRRSYRWQSLSDAARQCGIKVNTHRALGDCLATLEVLKRMVAEPSYNPPKGRGQL